MTFTNKALINNPIPIIAAILFLDFFMPQGVYSLLIKSLCVLAIIILVVYFSTLYLMVRSIQFVKSVCVEYIQESRGYRGNYDLECSQQVRFCESVVSPLNGVSETLVQSMVVLTGAMVVAELYLSSTLPVQVFALTLGLCSMITAVECLIELVRGSYLWQKSLNDFWSTVTSQT